MKHIGKWMVLFLLLGLISGRVYAQDSSLELLDIEVRLLENGTAEIVEKRVMEVQEGTEIYIPIGNLGQSTVVDLQVSEEGRKYENIGAWNSNKSRKDKKEKCGIIEYSDSVELCWGVGDYGSHTYVTAYKVTDFIKQLTDAQVLYWKFVNEEITPSPKKTRVSISMADGSRLDDKRNRIWAFGYEGTILFVDGKIVAESEGGFDPWERMIVLADFSQGTFSTQDRVDMTMKELEEQAKEGSDYSLAEDPSVEDSVFVTFIGVIFFVVIVGMLLGTLIFFIYVLFKRFGKFGVEDGSLDIEYVNESFRAQYRGEYYRDLANEEEFEDMTRILFLMGRDISNWITAFFLKWISEGRLEPVKKEEGLIFKKENTVLKIVEERKELPPQRSESERKLWSYVIRAAGKNAILETGEFTQFVLNKPNGLRTWRKNLLNHSKRILLDRGLVKEEERKKLFATKKVIILTEEGQKKREDIYRFYNYLYDFSLLNERDSVNVKVWDKLMIWAGALGITDRVQKEFQKLYPQYIDETVYQGDMIYVANRFAHSAGAGYMPSSTTASSGGGGFSSFGGGGGSYGGGSGGGIR